MPRITSVLSARFSGVWRLLCGGGRKVKKPRESTDAFTRWLQEMELQNRTAMLGRTREQGRRP